jgi:hypothetical protein
VKPGDLVVLHKSFYKMRDALGIGIILDSYENDDDHTVYYEIQWKEDRLWYSEYEIKVLCES